MAHNSLATPGKATSPHLKNKRKTQNKLDSLNTALDTELRDEWRDGRIEGRREQVTEPHHMPWVTITSLSRSPSLTFPVNSCRREPGKWGAC